MYKCIVDPSYRWDVLYKCIVYLCDLYVHAYFAPAPPIQAKNSVPHFSQS
jgi:hypothetical protein